ncbi:hypothetical protein LguiA_022178 [Lonicera macranthoides]
MGMEIDEVVGEGYSTPKRDGAQISATSPRDLDLVYKSLVKSRSTSSAVEIMLVLLSRKDDSVQQQKDGIQSTILHYTVWDLKFFIAFYTSSSQAAAPEPHRSNFNFSEV